MESLKKVHKKGKIPIALVVPKYGLMGGAESVVFEMGERLARMESLTVHVLAHRWKTGNAPIWFHKIPVVKFPRFLEPLSFAHFVDRWIRRHPDVLVHSHERIHQMDLFTFHGIPHRTWIREVRKKRMSLFDRATAWVEKRGMVNPRLANILPVSSLVKEEVLRCYGIPESRIRIMHPGIALERFTGLDRQACRKQVRARYDLASSDVVILFLGMNFEIKRLDLVMKGMAHALKRSPEIPWKLLVAGKGNLRKYRFLAKELGIGDRVIFAGPVTPVEPYYLAADLFAMPSWMDTFGMAVLEAMAAGLPVIISQKVGARDLITTGENGFVLSGHPSPEEMGGVLERLSEPHLRKSIGEMAQKKASEQSWDKVLEELVHIYISTGWPWDKIR